MLKERLLLFWIVGYALLWSICTTWLDPAVPYDAVEALNWAQNAEWGSPKNPWLVGMVFRPALWFSDLPLNYYWYAVHFLFIAVGLAGVWQLARELSGRKDMAWLAMLTLNLSGIINFDIISYNDNYLLVMLWPWMIYCFYLAMTRHEKWWVAFACVAALAAMAKYSTFAFIGPIFLSTLLYKKSRQSYRGIYIYLALGAGILLCIPNLLWLWQHDFAAFNWVDSQIKKGVNLHLPVVLLCVFYPLIILWGILRFAGVNVRWPQAAPKRVLLLTCLLPLAVICLWFFFHHGGHLTEWLQPFLVIAPALMVGCLGENPPKIKRGVLVSLSLFGVLVLGGYIAVMLANIHNAGSKMSNISQFGHDMQQRWDKRFSTPLTYVGGSHLAQWVTFYAPARPSIMTPWNNDTRPNIYNVDINESALRKQGAMLLVNARNRCNAEDFRPVLEQWPTLALSGMEEYSYKADPVSRSKLLCIAFIAPEQAGARMVSPAH